MESVAAHPEDSERQVIDPEGGSWSTEDPEVVAAVVTAIAVYISMPSAHERAITEISTEVSWPLERARAFIADNGKKLNDAARIYEAQAAALGVTPLELAQYGRLRAQRSSEFTRRRDAFMSELGVLVPDVLNTDRRSLEAAISAPTLLNLMKKHGLGRGHDGQLALAEDAEPWPDWPTDKHP